MSSWCVILMISYKSPNPQIIEFWIICAGLCLTLTFMTLTWPSPDLDLDLSLTIVHFEFWMLLITSKMRMGVQQRMKTVTTMTSIGTMAFMCIWGRSVLKTKLSWLIVSFSCLILGWLWKSCLDRAERELLRQSWKRAKRELKES